ncbi:MAG: DUF2284 domain-containing protein [Lachnospiraceae bacterium]|nr:DUF2284 domain-containing protein [Lachnospiraceae bacterium]
MTEFLISNKLKPISEFCDLIPPDQEISRYEAIIPIHEYFDSCVDISKFLGFCKQCPGYCQTWSCPSFDFDPAEYWLRYNWFHLIGIQIPVPDHLRIQKMTGEEARHMADCLLKPRKNDLVCELFQMEKQIPGSRALMAGGCELCGEGGCTRPSGKPCRHPDKLRHSVESLGGNVSLTVEKYLGQRILWMKDGKLPEYFMLICGLLYK